MRDNPRIIMTRNEVYMQDDDGQGWTLVENADGFPYQHFTDKEMQERLPDYFLSEADTQVPDSLDAEKVSYKAIVTSIGTYMQKEGDTFWLLDANTACNEYVPRRLTNEQVEKYFKNDKAQAELNEAVQKLFAAISEDIRVLGEHLHTICRETAENFRALCEQLQAGIIAAEKQAQEPQRPDYKVRPKCCTRAKVKRYKKQRSRER